MAISASERKEALLAAMEQQLDALRARGVRMAGNAFSPIVLIKGELDEKELADGELLAGKDGEALRSALLAIGWEPQDFCALATVTGEGEQGVEPVSAPGSALSVELFREALETLDPEAVVLLDNAASDAMREVYAEALSMIEDFNTAMLQPGLVAHVLGRRVLALDGFERALSDPREKQRMWAYLKQLPPLGAPY